MTAVAIPGLTLAGEPRAQLLPPSVKAREKARSARRLMVLVIALSLVATVGGIAWAYLQQLQAQQSLEAAQARTAEILAQQQQYAEAARLADLVAKTGQLQKLATSTEVQWLALTYAIAPYIPAELSWTGVAMQAPAPWEPALAPEGDLREPRVAVVTLELTGDSYAPAVVFVESIPALHGFSDVKVDKVELKDGVYTTTVRLTLDVDALSGRFAADADSSAAAGEGSEG
jgi:hypothetical protein